MSLNLPGIWIKTPATDLFASITPNKTVAITLSTPNTETTISLSPRLLEELKNWLTSASRQLSQPIKDEQP